MVGGIGVGVYGVYCGVPKKAQKGPLKQIFFFFHCGYKNDWNAFKFEMEVPKLYNNHHVKFCGPPYAASWRNLALKH